MELFALRLLENIIPLRAFLVLSRSPAAIGHKWYELRQCEWKGVIRGYLTASKGGRVLRSRYLCRVWQSSVGDLSIKRDRGSVHSAASVRSIANHV